MSCDPLKSIFPYRLTAIIAPSVPRWTDLICSIWQQTWSQHLVCQWVRRCEMMVDVDCQLAPTGRKRKVDGQVVIMTREYARNIRSDLVLTANSWILRKEYGYNYCCIFCFFCFFFNFHHWDSPGDSSLLSPGQASVLLLPDWLRSGPNLASPHFASWRDAGQNLSKSSIWEN